MIKVLLIEDDFDLANRLGRYFEDFGIEQLHVGTAIEGLKQLEQHTFDLLLLDVMLPEMNGFEVCKHIRKNNHVPIIMLTARGELSDKVLGLEVGADDYLDKPFEPRELVARIQRLVERSNNQSNELKLDCWNFENLSICLKQHQVVLDQLPVELTGMEFKLLTLLAKSPGEVFSRDQILNQLKGLDSEIYSRSVDILVSRIRSKLSDSTNNTRFIKTIRNAGYVFVERRL